MCDFDDYFSNISKCVYFRYVDDILLFCKEEDWCSIFDEIHGTLKGTEYLLDLNNDKKSHGFLDQNCSIDFLGYNFDCSGTIRIARKNIQRLEVSLDNIFSEYKNSSDKRIKGNIELLKWKLHFRITGCFKECNKYGWVIFFRLNEDKSIYYHLDYLLNLLVKKYKLSAQLKISKKFVKTHHEFINKQTHSRYIPDVDKYSQEKKKNIN